MWIAVIVVSVLVAFGLPLTYYLMKSEDVSADIGIMEEGAYRKEILKEEGYTIGGYSGSIWYSKPMTEENKEKYKKYKNKMEKKEKRLTRFLYFIPVIVAVVLYAVFGLLGAYIENKNLGVEIAKYEASKYTIEKSLQNTDLTGLERLELVKTASEKNEWLSSQKYQCKQWYRFYLDDSKLEELEFINLGE